MKTKIVVITGPFSSHTCPAKTRLSLDNFPNQTNDLPQTHDTANPIPDRKATFSVHKNPQVSVPSTTFRQLTYSYSG